MAFCCERTRYNEQTIKSKVIWKFWILIRTRKRWYNRKKELWCINMSISEVTIFSDPFSPPSSLFVTIFGNSLSSPLGDVIFWWTQFTQAKLSKGVQKIFTRFSQNLLKANIDKCHLITFHRLFNLRAGSEKKAELVEVNIDSRLSFDFTLLSFAERPVKTVCPV